MTNCLLSYPNRVDAAVLTLGSWAGTLDNLLDRQISLCAVSTDVLLTSTRFQLDLQATYAIRCIALRNHNLSPAAKWRITIGSTPGGSDIYDSGWLDCWRMTFDLGLLPWGMAGLWRHIDAQEFVGHDRDVNHVITGGWMDGRYVTIEIDDTTNPDGHVFIGRPFVGGGLQPVDNFNWGMSEGWKDRTTVQQTPGGAKYFQNVAPARFADFSLDWLQAAEFERVYEMQRLLGVSGELYWIPDPSDADAMQRRGFLGTMRELTPIEWPYVGVRKKAFRLEELMP